MTLLKRRDGQLVYSKLTDLPGKPVVAKEALSIICPVRFKEIGLAQIGSPSFVFGLFAIVLDSGEYGLVNVTALFELGPGAIEIISVDGVDYYRFRFNKGDVVFRTKELVKRTQLVFKALDEFFFKGKVPFYVGYEDMGKLFDSAKKHSGTSATILPSVTEWITAFIARQKQDRTKYLREGAKKDSDFSLEKLEWVPLTSVYWSAIGTVNKLAGAYFEDGVVSALVNPSDRVETIERVLRA